MSLHVVILAAGKGTRMQSKQPKVLHQIGGLSMLQHTVATAKALGAEKIIVIYGHGGEQVQQAIQDDAIVWVEQKEQLGTGHAVQQAIPELSKNLDDQVLILYADVPLVRTTTLANLLNQLEEASLAILSTQLKDPTGYGRIVRDENDHVAKIVEEKDADSFIRKINEINTGIIAAKCSGLINWLNQLTDNNAQGEYYLTDCAELAVRDAAQVKASICADPHEVMGVNSRLQLAELETVYQQRERKRLMLEGVTCKDPNSLYIEGNVQVGKDIIIEANVLLRGDVVIEDDVTIEMNAIVINSHIKQGSIIHPNTHIEDAQIGEKCELGPYARIRPATVLAKNVKLGNFVEVKKAVISEGSKVNHLSYIGDAQVGSNTNIGAGTICCNYDGANKYKTEIGDNVFIGSDTQLVAPVKIDHGATIGAGSTITKDVPAEKLTLSRSKQITINNWQRPSKNK